MDEHIPPQDPNGTDDDAGEKYDKWQDIGSREPASPLTPDQAQALGAQGLGGGRLVAREKSRQDDISHGIGTNEPPLPEDARASAHNLSIEIRRARLQERRNRANQMPEGSEKSDELARIRMEEDKLDKSE